MEFLDLHRYVMGMVRILLIFALVVTGSLKHFERAPVFASATADTVFEFTIADGLSTAIVKVPGCNNNHYTANSTSRSHKSDCKAVLRVTAYNSVTALDDHFPVRGWSATSNIRPVDLRPPIA